MKYMKKISLLILVLGLSTCAYADDAKLDAHIASQIHQINQMEMHMGKIAQAKGTTAEVRDFGVRVYKDHAAADLKIKKIAADMKLEISEPIARNDQERKQQQDTAALMKKLESTTGKEFDQAFLKGMYDGHREVISMMNAELQDLGPSDLRSFVSSTLIPNLHQHEDIAMSIEQRVYV